MKDQQSISKSTTNRLADHDSQVISIMQQLKQQLNVKPPQLQLMTEGILPSTAMETPLATHHETFSIEPSETIL